ncbi:hypothetical protein AAHN93_10605 [Vandammella animalimorsus]|uniref:hypothetical protein n=1 Tax=Vandammella animalimorsus TaxID=2029117 RepID=UPI0031BAF012
MQPDAGKGMAFGEDQQRVQSCLLKRGAEQQREVEAGAKAGAFDLAGAAHLLAGLLETGGRQGIVQLHACRGPPESRGQLPGALGAASIAVQRRIATVLAQHLGAAFEQPIHRRVIGLHKRGNQVRQMREAAPLVARQQFQTALVPCKSRGGRLRAHGAQCQRNRGRLCFRQPCQQSAVQAQVQIADWIARMRRQRIDPPTTWFQKGRLGSQDEFDLLMRLVGFVDQREIPDQRDCILKVRQIQFGDQGHVDLQLCRDARTLRLCLVHGIPFSACRNMNYDMLRH